MDVSAVKFDAAGLVPVVVQDRQTGEVRMLAWADRAALERTLETGEGHFFSRSRGGPWRKGETSGNVLAVLEVFGDCDADAVIYLVDPIGPTCHTGRRSCFFAPLGGPTGPDAAPSLVRVGDTLEARREATAEKSYTRSLLDGGPARIGEKLREEADELARAVASESEERVVAEGADLLYHLMVALLARGKSLRDVAAELARRHGRSGHDEKASR